MNEDGPTKAPGVNEANKPAGAIAAGLAALTGVLVAAGVTGDVTGRMVGEEPYWFGVGLILVVVGGVFAMIATLHVRKTKGERRLLVWGNWLLLLGLVCTAIAAVGVWSNTRRPSVAATPEATADGTVLNVSVKDSGLDSTERVTLLVEPLNLVRGTRTRPFLVHRATIYSASLGSNDDGKVDHTVRLRLAAGLTGFIGARAYLGDDLPKDCYKVPASGQGCVVVEIPHDAERPQLSASWGAANETLIVNLKARQNYGGTITLRALGKASGPKATWSELASWSLAADSNGGFDRTLTVPGVSRFTSVCVVASRAGRRKCPPPKGSSPRLVWLRYRVPPK
jgi:hypothetical protein